MIHPTLACIQKYYKSHTQWIATIAAMMVLMQAGFMAGWVSPNVARLTSPNSPIHLTLDEVSWVASISNIGRLIGMVVIIGFIEKFGSKTTVVFGLFPISCTWIIMMVANSFTLLIIARFLGGISISFIFSVIPLYVAEISRPSLRGTMIILTMCGGLLGQLCALTAEVYLTMTISSSIYLVFCLVTLVIMACLPNSPYYLAKINNLSSACESIAWYGAGEVQVEKELVEVKRFVELDSEMSIKNKFRQLKSPSVRRAVLFITTLNLLTHLCGYANFLSYMEVILVSAKISVVKPANFVIYQYMISFTWAVLTGRLIDKLGRRILLMISSVCIFMSLSAVGLHFYLLSTGMNPERLQWLALISIPCVCSSYTMGFMPIPTTVTSEIFPSSMKSLAVCGMGIVSSIMIFIISMTYYPMINAIGQAYVFWIYAICALLAVPYAIFIMPETKGKSLQEIQEQIFEK